MDWGGIKAGGDPGTRGILQSCKILMNRKPVTMALGMGRICAGKEALCSVIAAHSGEGTNVYSVERQRV